MFTVELIQNFNGKFDGWQTFGPFDTKREAWNFIKSKGYIATDKGDKWLAYPASTGRDCPQCGEPDMIFGTEKICGSCHADNDAEDFDRCEGQYAW